MDIETRNKALEILCSMSDRQVDPQAKFRIRPMLIMSNEELIEPLLYLLDDCCYYSWTSDFEIMVLDHIWKQIGGKSEDMIALRSKREASKALTDTHML